MSGEASPTDSFDEEPAGADGAYRPVAERHVGCAACGAPVDPLRAGHVAIFDAEFRFFCDFYRCRQAYVGGEAIEPPPQVTPPPPSVTDPTLGAVLPPVRAAVASAPDEPVPDRLEVEDDDELVEPLPRPISTTISPNQSRPIDPADEVPVASSAERRDMGALLVGLALVAGLLTMALELAAATRLLALSRLVLVGVGAAALLGRALTEPSDPARPHWLVVVVTTIYAALIAGWTLFTGQPAGVGRAAFLAGTVLSVSAVNYWLVAYAARGVLAHRAWLGQRLDVAARRVVGEPTALAQKELVFDVRPGEHILVDDGETVAVDLEIVEGEAEVLPWPGETVPVRRAVGDVMVAGARVVEGSLRGKCLQAGDDRAFARPLAVGEARADANATLPLRMRRLSERWAPVLALVVGGLSAALGRDAVEVALVVVAVYAAFGNVAIGSLVGLAMARGIRLAMRRGILYASATSWDRCARVTAAIFCARGTLLRGEPDLVEVEVIAQRRGDTTRADDVLALAAGLLSGDRTPVALAVRRAAAERNLRPMAVRDLRPLASRGVAAIASSGESVCVGNRSLLIEKHVSVAVAEERLVELEGAGRSVLLVARGGRLLGILALQDGLRSGARAAVQHVLDARIEPILMSADTRETCAALGRALDIDHLRPEVLDDERAGAVERIRETGALVAVMGHSPFDDPALEAADAAVVLNAAGRDRSGHAVLLASDDPRAAALSLALAQRTRSTASAVALLLLVPAAFGALVVATGILPAEYAPLAQLVGSFVALGQLRGLDK